MRWQANSRDGCSDLNSRCFPSPEMCVFSVFITLPSFNFSAVFLIFSFTKTSAHNIVEELPPI
jgi:hypothetical protein